MVLTLEHRQHAYRQPKMVAFSGRDGIEAISLLFNMAPCTLLLLSY